MMQKGKKGWASARRAERIALRIGRLYLTGLGPEVQGAVLADLVATWLAGHMPMSEDERPSVDKIRKELFDDWCTVMWQCVPINEDMIRERYKLPPRPRNEENTDASKID